LPTDQGASDYYSSINHRLKQHNYSRYKAFRDHRLIKHWYTSNSGSASGSLWKAQSRSCRCIYLMRCNELGFHTLPSCYRRLWQ